MTNVVEFPGKKTPDIKCKETPYITCNETWKVVLQDRVLVTLGEAVGGSPWSGQTEDAVKALLTAIDTAIEGNDVLKDVFNASLKIPADPSHEPPTNPFSGTPF